MFLMEFNRSGKIGLLNLWTHSIGILIFDDDFHEPEIGSCLIKILQKKGLIEKNFDEEMKMLAQKRRK